jgi:hypothetical protein
MVSAWAQDEMASADFGDLRLDGRAAVLLSAVGNHPNMSIPAACGGRSEMAAAYRFFDNPKVTFDTVLQSHWQCTRRRINEQEVALLVQDTSEIDLTRPRQEVTGAGELDGSRRGVLLHALHAFTPDGTPLGTAWARCLIRPEVSHASRSSKSRRQKQTPIEQKESMRWIEGLRQTREIAAALPGVQCICIGDSESDIYECLAESRAVGDGGPPVYDWLIRGCHDRTLAEDSDPCSYLRERVLGTKVLYRAELGVRERQAKTNVETRGRRQTRRTREATVEVRAATVMLRPPRRHDRELPPVEVNVVLVLEPNPPAGEAPIQWILLTSLPIDTPEQARRVVEYYCVRWNIEILFRTLKSGCRVEHRRFEHIDRILPCMALYLIVAWRTLLVCRLGRECPDADCQTLFEPSEWKAVWAAVNRTKPPKKRPTLSQMVHLIAQLGGYVQRPSSEPGPQTIWIGLQRMYDLSWAWDAFGPGASTNGA